jgi:hypothetical protein
VLSIQRCRRLLGDEANHLTDEEVERIRVAMYVFADVAIEARVSREPQPESDGEEDHPREATTDVST